MQEIAAPQRPEAAATGAAGWLGAELRRLRLEEGISQRKLTRLIGLSAHSNLGDYERGRRIPPADIVEECERLLTVKPGYLQRLRRLALKERARAGLRGGFACRASVTADSRQRQP
ncbi:MAG TPA: helix-turn-helix transcriptional regulator [Streptosporangiaceae bacterium]|nr:helix-turn-helix transcriptional regulator [Streptosporangiaceae bacterium]